MLRAMPIVDLITDFDAVNAYLIEHGLTESYAPISVALLQHGGMSTGHPVIMLVLEVDGQKVLAKTSLQMMETICSAMRAASGVQRDP